MWNALPVTLLLVVWAVLFWFQRRGGGTPKWLTK